MEERQEVFVYGTLKNNAKNQTPFFIKGKLYDFGAFPAATEVGNADAWIKGHIIKVTEIQIGFLDHIESAPWLYRRVRVKYFASKDDVKPAGEAWVYEYTYRDLSAARTISEEWEPYDDTAIFDIGEVE